MNDDAALLDAFVSLRIPKTHVTVGLSNFISHNNDFRSLFMNRRLPFVGWSNIQIQYFLFFLSSLDTNQKITIDCSDATSKNCHLDSSTTVTESVPCVANSNNDDDKCPRNQYDATSSKVSSSIPRWCSVGEREGRVYSSLVGQRHFGLSHGIGRSGDLSESQPKALGSTIIAKLTSILVLDAIRRGVGYHAKTSAKHGIILPLCTGMSISLALSSLRESNPQRNVVLWSRIDQKSCYKAILSAGLQCIVVPTKLMNNGDEVGSDLEAMTRAIETYLPDNILAIITTTSCFAPRIPDQVDEVAKLAQKYNIHHVINNAYGLQCPHITKLINRACIVGRVDAIVCSTDKNFLVPVGKNSKVNQQWID
jgi:O-phosphoseryl-tRNA(Sec) selenium transferase, SepSecS